MHAVLMGLALLGYLKGQLHVHSNASGDSATPPAEVARWYAARHYDFIVLTDHERVTVGVSVGDMLVLPGVELTQNLETCTPPPRPGLNCLLHVNALLVTPRARVPWPPVISNQRLDRYLRALDATRALGGIAQLNHPNFHYAADAALVRQLVDRGLLLMEVANQSADVNNTPAGEPSTEAIWDEVLSGGGKLWGTATDDAHHYDDAAARARAGEQVFVGDLGFVMVHAERNPAAIRDALVRGDFYSSSGVILDRLQRTADRLEVAVAGGARCRFRFIGPGGAVLQTSQGSSATLSLRGRKGYVRVVVEDGARRAWTQPLFLDGR